MAKHDIPLRSLKDCLMFLEWLHKNDGKQQEVARELHGRISKYFQKGATHFNLGNVRIGLSQFLATVSAFYTRLCYNPEAGKYVSKQPKEIVDALLECLPKFLAAIYFLEYCVNPAFKDLGGGGWEQNWPAWDAGTSSGGDLAIYLYAKTDDSKYNSRTGLIPGGLTSGEVKYNIFSLHRIYTRGYNMVGDLGNIMRKGNYNFLRSVFVTSVFSTDRGTAMQNTANAVSLVRTFCDIVEAEAKKSADGGKLKLALEDGIKMLVPPRSICWEDLKTHCAELREKLGKLFNNTKRFDFTGQSTDTRNLNKEELAKETANWMREKLIHVRGNLSQIKTDIGVLALPKENLGEYFTKHFFPYGFIFKERFHLSDSDVRGLKTDWRNVIDDLKKRNGSDLDRLVEILNGDGPGSCQSPPPPPKKPEVPPAKVPEGAQNQGKKSEGAQNQGKKDGPSPNQNNGQSEEKSPRSPVADSTAPALPPGNGGSGPAGPKVDKGDVGPDGGKGATGPQGPTGDPGPTGPVVSASSQDHVQTNPKAVQPPQNTNITPRGPPPPPADPSTSASPSIPGQPGPTGQGSPGDVTPGQQLVPPQGPVLAQSTSASGSSAGPTGVQGAGTQGGKDVSSVGSAPGVTVPSKGGSGVGGTDGDSAGIKKLTCEAGQTLGKSWYDGREICISKSKTPAFTSSPFEADAKKAWDAYNTQLSHNNPPRHLNTQDNHIPPSQGVSRPPNHPSHPTGHHPGTGLPAPQPDAMDTYLTLSGTTVDEKLPNQSPILDGDKIYSWPQMKDDMQEEQRQEVGKKSV
ncbi:ribosome binding protein, putative [Babesia ovata]|uniref:Ribosome binding protein, putative n=1 Tax=Babesia ovata TaxID=189622 RepID=A0A2H6KFM3_9APIC|nr:ribosome binding protein, putative [Babesia ovata]GBE61787.1 ribosome binding protein, putative [Babesia ovata]